MILLHQKLTFKIKLTWSLRKCVLVHYNNELFSITATKEKQVAVPTEVRTYLKVSLVLATIAAHAALLS